MTSLHAAIAAAALALAAILTIGIGTGRLAAETARTSAAWDALHTLERDAQRLESLRHARQVVGSGTQPQADALALVHRALSDAGLNSRAIRSLTPSDHHGAAPTSDSRYSGHTTQRARLTLGGITLPELGGFLDHWARSQAVWGIERIALRAEDAALARTGPPRWTASMTLAATYWNDGDQP